MHMVMGLEVLGDALRASEAAFVVLVVISRNCTERQGIGNRRKHKRV
jgi:hypothetical protein